MTSRERNLAGRVRTIRLWLAVAGMLAIAGCSASPTAEVATGHHDDGIRLTPDPAHATARISVVLADANVMPSMCTYEWRRNDLPLRDAVGDGLEPTFFTKNDEISVVVTIADPKGGPARVLHADVKVVNSPPRVTSVSVLAGSAPGEPTVEARPQAIDPDGDTPTFTYRWFKNGQVIDGATNSTLPLKLAGRGSKLVCEVVAHDGEADSPPVKSEAMAVENRPPQFTSSPGAPAQTDVTFQYQAHADDPDGDPVKYDLVSGPSGMSVSPDGLVSWMLPTGDQRQGDYAARIRAKDPNGGEATQDFTVHLEAPIVQTSTTTVRTTSAGVGMGGGSGASGTQAPPQPLWHVVRHSYFKGDSTSGQ